MYFCEVEEGDMIYDEAINGTCFFILDKGLLEITTEGSKKILKPQDGKDKYKFRIWRISSSLQHEEKLFCESTLIIQIMGHRSAHIS